MELPKILVTSIPCWNSQTGSDTFSNLLDGYGSEQIANIYTRVGVPSSDACNNYFQISEGDILRSVFKKGISTGKKTIKNQETSTIAESKEKRRYGFFSKHRLTLFLALRECAWKLGNWKSSELEEFVENFNPDILFFPIESYIYFNRINEYLIKKTGKRAVGFLWDDNFTYKSVTSLGEKIMRFFTRRSVRKLAGMCDVILAINPKMKQECDAFLGVDSVLLSKGIDFSDLDEPKKHDISKPIHLLYAGKLNIGRDKTVEMLSEEISEVNSNGERIHFDIYSTTLLSDRQKERISQKGCQLHDPVPQTQLAAIRDKADVLVFVESLTKKYRNTARLSFSTKITDYLGAGKCILAIGPDDIAPMEYLAQNGAALCAENRQDLKNILPMLLEDSDLIYKMGCAAFQLGKQNHDIIHIRKVLWSIFEQLI